MQLNILQDLWSPRGSLGDGDVWISSDLIVSFEALILPRSKTTARRACRATESRWALRNNRDGLTIRIHATVVDHAHLNRKCPRKSQGNDLNKVKGEAPILLFLGFGRADARGWLNTKDPKTVYLTNPFPFTASRMHAHSAHDREIFKPMDGYPVPCSPTPSYQTLLRHIRPPLSTLPTHPQLIQNELLQR